MSRPPPRRASSRRGATRHGRERRECGRGGRGGVAWADGSRNLDFAQPLCGVFRSGGIDEKARSPLEAGNARESRQDLQVPVPVVLDGGEVSIATRVERWIQVRVNDE